MLRGNMRIGILSDAHNCLMRTTSTITLQQGFCPLRETALFQRPHRLRRGKSETPKTIYERALDFVADGDENGVGSGRASAEFTKLLGEPR